MANKPLQSIKFPGLSDTYTTPQVDATLTTTGAAADAKKVGDEITSVKQDLSEINDFLYEEKNYLDVVSNPTGTYDQFVNNGDGTFTFKTTDYGTCSWKSLGAVPPGEYKLNGTAGFGFFAVSTNGAYSGATVIKTNGTQNEVTFTNPTEQILYVVLRCNGAPSQEFTVAPFIKGMVEKNYATMKNVDEAVGGEPITFVAGFIATNTATVNINSVQQSVSFKHAIVDCVEGDYFTIEATGGIAPRAWCFIDAQGNNLSRSKKGESVSTILKAPTGASKIIINNNADTASYKGIVLRRGVAHNYSTIQDMIDNGVYYDKNFIDASVNPTGTYDQFTNNGDGTFTFKTTDSGTATWKSKEKVPIGRYRLSGLSYSSYTFFAVSTDGAYSGATVLATNEQFDEISFDNPEEQYLYISLRANSRPSVEFTVAPGIRKYIIPECVIKHDGTPGQILSVNSEGDIVPSDVVDNTLGVSGKAADAKKTGDCIKDLKQTHSNYKRTCKIYAHQGFGGNGARLNTVSALLQAQKAGCDGMETDIRQTSDGVMVISHDATITGTVNEESVTKTISESTLAELKELLLATSDVYGAIYISTLEELLQAAAYTGMKLLLEYKGGTIENIPKMVMRTGMQGRVTYMCSPSYYSRISAIDKHASFACVYFDYGSVIDFSDFTPHLTDNNTIGIDYISSSAETPDFTNLYAAQEAGLSIDFWNFTTDTLKMLDVNPRNITINSNIISAIDNYISQKQLT